MIQITIAITTMTVITPTTAPALKIPVIAEQLLNKAAISKTAVIP